MLPDFRRLIAFFPFAAGNDAFTFVADVDQDEFVVDAQDFAVDDLVDGQLSSTPIDFFGCRAAHRLGQLFLPLVLFEIQSANQVTVDHVF